MNGRSIVVAGLAATLVGVLFVPGEAIAYSRYNDGCQICHGNFADPYSSPKGGTWTTSLHVLHRNNSYMGAACDLCHSANDANNPWIRSSSGTATAPKYGCLGCHGAVIAGTPSGIGLRRHHALKGMTNCTSGCHTNTPTPVAESVKPPYYGLPDSKVASSCNNDTATTEDWGGTSVGLDNDGDGLYDGADPDCSTNPCGNGKLDPGETCDPPSSCPTSCNDNDACTSDVLSGSAAACTAACTFTPKTACTDGDGCCPAACNANNDTDCAPKCGNSVIETGETCDPTSTCPTSCTDGNSCTTDVLSGSAAACTSKCAYTPLLACVGGDGCCPSGCNANNDNNCSPSCGNGVVETGETCDPQGTCATTCNDGNACTTDVMTGALETCNVACSRTNITLCANNDGCCPAGCNALDDNNCSATCGNSVVESGETCDPPSKCPANCDDGNACSIDIQTGTSATCNVACTRNLITSCNSNDGCCPAGCNANTDNDCSAACGNGVIESGETCDPPSKCLASCDDGSACTVDSKTGDSTTCNVACSHNAITTCVGSDGCCPTGCTANTDSDCSATCDNGFVEAGETCDPPSSCPATCNDGNSCTIDSQTGASSTCNLACNHATITTCVGGDGCCPAGCKANKDSDCSASCGNGTVEQGETCDPPSSCPTSCSDGNNCTLDSLTGSAANCNVVCAHSAISSCADGDGCCPTGCNANIDDSCSPSCGNATIEAGETCDPPSSCSPTCDDGVACTIDSTTGSAVNCNLACGHTTIAACANGDGCCPAGCNSIDDNDCSPSCGNSVVETGETCDPPSKCPSTCDDGIACTIDSSSGSSANCNLACSHTSIASCANNDGCCPAGCNANNDLDCVAVCDNGAVEAGESCDPKSSCPASCDDANACTFDALTGSADQCNVSCAHTAITLCGGADGCCPSGCNSSNDGDCSISCGNSVIETGETCDPQSTCPATCDDSDACTTDLATGSVANCNAECSHAAIAICSSGDGCCPVACDSTSDSDCAVVCGNSVVEVGETCDGNCPASCDDSNACTVDVTTGSAATCNVACSSTAIIACASGDGCCPSGCTSTNDSDCSISCGNGIVETGESCDPVSSCPTTCDDTNVCTIDMMTGSAENCNAACSNTEISACANDDGCCPAGCDSSSDNNCSPTCGNGKVDTDETCDPPGTCPTTCDDSNACTKDSKTGSAANCNVQCGHAPVTACTSADGCCPAGCTSSTDSDCKVSDGGLPDSGPDSGTTDGGTKVDGGSKPDSGVKTDGGAQPDSGAGEPLNVDDDGGCGCEMPGRSKAPWSLSAAAWLAALALARLARRRP